MTVLTFPSNPQYGDAYTAPNGTLYTYDGVKWVVTTTTITREAVTNFVQDAVAPIFENIESSGITFSYNQETNTLTANVDNQNTGDLGFNGSVMYRYQGVSVDNSDLTHSSTAGIEIPANGTGTLTVKNKYGDIKLTADTDGINSFHWHFNGDGTTQFPNYTFPVSDGTSGQVLATDGSGNLTWQDQTGSGGGISISDFGEGFSLNNTNKIVTNKLYSTNQTNSNQHYRLTLDNNGVVVLPDQSIINGATLRVVPGTGELNYAALAAGPDTDHPEKTWIWADTNGAWVETNSYDSGHVWQFNNDGVLNLPTSNYIAENAANIHSDGHIVLSAATKNWSFDDTGNLTLPEGGDIKNINGDSLLVSSLFNQSLNSGDQVQFRSVRAEGFIVNGSDPYAYEIRVTNPDADPAPVTFTRHNNTPNDVDHIAPGLTIKRLNGGAIFNFAQESSYSGNFSPAGTRWNADGWEDLSDIYTRTYTDFENACDNAIGENVTHRHFVMHDTINDQYWAIKFEWWQPGGGGGASLPLDSRGGFKYTRYPIDTVNGFERVVRPYNDDTIVDNIDTDLTIARAAAGGIYNSAVEAEWDPDVSPAGTLWNDEGWSDLSQISGRNFYPLYTAVHGQLGNHLVGRELVMWDTVNDKYYTVKFTEWGQNNGGSFAYVRRELLPFNHQIGLKFSDGTVQKSAYVPYRNISINDVSGTISVADGNDLRLETTAEYGVNADISISSSQDLWMYAGGEAQIIASNEFKIVAGDSEYWDWSQDGVWDGQTFVIYAYPYWDAGQRLNQYLNSTYNIQFRKPDGTWVNTYSTSNATYDDITHLYTIPVAANNDTGTPINTSYVRIRDLNYQGNEWWSFNRDGMLELPYGDYSGISHRNTFTRVSEGAVGDPGGIIWTSRNNGITSAKLTIQIEVSENGGDGSWHTQVCEASIAKRSNNSGDPMMTVYAVTHTSNLPLATFTVQRNPTTNYIEVVATKTAAANGGLQYRVHSVELGTRD